MSTEYKISGKLRKVNLSKKVLVFTDLKRLDGLIMSSSAGKNECEVFTDADNKALIDFNFEVGKTYELTLSTNDYKGDIPEYVTLAKNLEFTSAEQIGETHVIDYFFGSDDGYKPSTKLSVVEDVCKFTSSDKLTVFLG